MAESKMISAKEKQRQLCEASTQYLVIKYSENIQKKSCHGCVEKNRGWTLSCSKRMFEKPKKKLGSEYKKKLGTR